MSYEPIREVRCIHCGDYTPGVYEAHHKEMMRQFKEALERATARFIHRLMDENDKMREELDERRIK